MVTIVSNSETTITAIANWAASTKDFSALSVKRAQEAISDTVGCVIAGASDPTTVMLRQAVGEGVGYSAVGGQVGVPGHAALVNATSAHVLDFDDTFRPLMGHASAVLVPALLAVAEHRTVSGRDLIMGYLVGLEAQGRLGAGMNPDHYAAGWHATATIGVIGAAVGVARMLRLECAEMASSMSLACSMASGIKGQFGTHAKPLHAGLCARNAVEAVMMAKCGLSGRHDIIEHRFGFQRLYAGRGVSGANISKGLGGPHMIETTGLTPKRFPCCAATHKILDMVLDLKNAHDLDSSKVLSVETFVGRINAGNLPYKIPSNEIQAKFSMNFCVALAIVKGNIKISDFSSESLESPDIRRLMPLVEMHSSTLEDESGINDLPHKVSIRMDDGRLLTAERRQQKGTVHEPFDKLVRDQKFHDCCDENLNRDTTFELIDFLERLEEHNNLNYIFQAIGEVNRGLGRI
ncbi:MmgE/PrpD family protein [Pararhizobium sp. YC-54]|uniref:MmgE/PrpD family protein n=1 Tax=Pararhizobium sp. YC-54 TaxID=2986920 RepID=UPI0021F7FF79|nr:MmgE/PrpD family protein [Pararhizobium sp. YC-54]MCW0001527.1 MmgE/PrpD family protein [Pararhizobium sp. YC-54]